MEAGGVRPDRAEDSGSLGAIPALPRLICSSSHARLRIEVGARGGLPPGRAPSPPRTCTDTCAGGGAAGSGPLRPSPAASPSPS